MKLRGHDIRLVGGEYVFTDTGELTAATWKDRPCGYCGRWDTDAGHDGCLGELPGVMNACCGHGVTREAYVQFWDGSTVHGEPAIDVMRELVRRRDSRADAARRLG